LVNVYDVKLMRSERKILRKIYGPTKLKDCTWRIKTDEESILFLQAWTYKGISGDSNRENSSITTNQCNWLSVSCCLMMSEARFLARDTGPVGECLLYMPACCLTVSETREAIRMRLKTEINSFLLGQWCVLEAVTRNSVKSEPP
jgi:hypothetical protein